MGNSVIIKRLGKNESDNAFLASKEMDSPHFIGRSSHSLRVVGDDQGAKGSALLVSHLV